MNSVIPIDQQSFPLIHDYLDRYPPIISELTLTNIYVWRTARPTWFCEIDNTLIFLIKPDRCHTNKWVLFGPPIGPAAIQDIFNHLGSDLIGGVRLTADVVSGLDSTRFFIAPDRDNADYVYRVQDLIELKGRNFAGKRNHIKQCLGKYHCEFERLVGDTPDECLELLSQWCTIRECDLDPGLRNESRAILETIQHFNNFRLFGGAIRIDGDIAAFCIGERLNHDTAVCHFEKALPHFTGLGQLINQWMARECLQEYTYVNREQDLGIPGLRQAKETYYPDHMIVKFSAYRKDVATQVDHGYDKG
ncbi:MAG: DUF2156 domain-containing protein [Proteobacteria bacterium]|nr:DUF2156 domain-containing protein [Pseudomonadota bacterium]MBU1686433.1 DUF2156 domain-containing protein [Pseudomonadota bacterium]